MVGSPFDNMPYGNVGQMSKSSFKDNLEMLNYQQKMQMQLMEAA